MSAATVVGGDDTSESAVFPWCEPRSFGIPHTAATSTTNTRNGASRRARPEKERTFSAGSTVVVVWRPNGFSFVPQRFPSK